MPQVTQTCTISGCSRGSIAGTPASWSNTWTSGTDSAANIYLSVPAFSLPAVAEVVGMGLTIHAVQNCSTTSMLVCTPTVLGHYFDYGYGTTFPYVYGGGMLEPITFGGNQTLTGYPNWNTTSIPYSSFNSAFTIAVGAAPMVSGSITPITTTSTATIGGTITFTVYYKISGAGCRVSGLWGF